MSREASNRISSKIFHEVVGDRNNSFRMSPAFIVKEKKLSMLLAKKRDCIRYRTAAIKLLLKMRQFSEKALTRR